MLPPPRSQFTLMVAPRQGTASMSSIRRRSRLSVGGFPDGTEHGCIQSLRTGARCQRSVYVQKSPSDPDGALFRRWYPAGEAGSVS